MEGHAVQDPAELSPRRAGDPDLRDHGVRTVEDPPRAASKPHPAPGPPARHIFVPARLPCGSATRVASGRGTGETVVELSGDIDVHKVTHERAGLGTLLPSRRRTLATARRTAGPVTGLLLPIALTFLLDLDLDLDVARGRLNLTSEALPFLFAVVGAARSSRWTS
ncbi:hypothetical protein [Streptomyces rishiriensis]